MSFFNLFRRNKNKQESSKNSNATSIPDKPNYSIDIKIENQNNDYLLDNPVLEDGLSYGDILMLDWLNGQKTNKKVPGYFVESFQINPLASKQKYKKMGLLISGSVESRLQTLRVPELKEILKKNNQKISGRKNELINRIKQNINENYYINDLPKTYGLSSEALSLLKKYELLIWASNNEHILSPKDYIPFIDSKMEEPEIAINLLEKHINKLIKQNEPFSAYPLSNTESEIATFYHLLNDTNNYIKHAIYSILIEYLCVTEIKEDYYSEPHDFNTQYIQTHTIDYLQDQGIDEELVNLIVTHFIQRYDSLLTTLFKENPELGTKAIIDALVLQPNEYHKNRMAILKKLRRNK